MIQSCLHFGLVNNLSLLHSFHSYTALKSWSSLIPLDYTDYKSDKRPSLDTCIASPYSWHFKRCKTWMLSVIIRPRFSLSTCKNKVQVKVNVLNKEIKVDPEKQIKQIKFKLVFCLYCAKPTCCSETLNSHPLNINFRQTNIVFSTVLLLVFFKKRRKKHKRIDFCSCFVGCSFI